MCPSATAFTGSGRSAVISCRRNRAASDLTAVSIDFALAGGGGDVGKEKWRGRKEGTRRDCVCARTNRAFGEVKGLEENKECEE